MEWSIYAIDSFPRCCPATFPNLDLKNYQNYLYATEFLLNSLNDVNACFQKSPKMCSIPTDWC